MKKSIWSNADVYGQIAVWLLSVIPFIYFFPEALRKNDFYMLILVHGLGLLIIGVWQMVSTLLNLLLATEEHKGFFRKNIWVGLVLGLVFFFWAHYGYFKVPLPPAEYRNGYFIGAYFLMVDIAAIRYWRYINRYYKQMNHD